MKRSAYYCYNCGWNCNPEFWETMIGRKWVCKGCGISGNCGEYGEPELLLLDAQKDNEPDASFCERVFGRISEEQNRMSIYETRKASDIKVGDRLKAGKGLDCIVKSISIENNTVHVSYSMRTVTCAKSKTCGSEGTDSMPGGTLWRGEWDVNELIEVMK